MSLQPLTVEWKTQETEDADARLLRVFEILLSDEDKYKYEVNKTEVPKDTK